MFRETITLVPADNLASQYLGGYKALNSAMRKCRHCLAVKETMESQVCYMYVEVYSPQLKNILH